MRILVVCGPRAGNTRAAATELAAALHADLDLIIAREQRDGVIGWLRDAYDNTFEHTTEIARPARNVDEYDLVVVGSPTSDASVAGPVRTFLDRYGVRAHTLALFVTSSGRGGDRALDAMTTLAHKAPVGRLVLHDDDVQSGAAHERIIEFAKRLVDHFSGLGRSTPASLKPREPRSYKFATRGAFATPSAITTRT